MKMGNVAALNQSLLTPQAGAKPSVGDGQDASVFAAMLSGAADKSNVVSDSRGTAAMAPVTQGVTGSPSARSGAHDMTATREQPGDDAASVSAPLANRKTDAPAVSASLEATDGSDGAAVHTVIVATATGTPTGSTPAASGSVSQNLTAEAAAADAPGNQPLLPRVAVNNSSPAPAGGTAERGITSIPAPSVVIQPAGAPAPVIASRAQPRTMVSPGAAMSRSKTGRGADETDSDIPRAKTKAKLDTASDQIAATVALGPPAMSLAPTAAVSIADGASAAGGNPASVDAARPGIEPLLQPSTPPVLAAAGDQPGANDPAAAPTDPTLTPVLAALTDSAAIRARYQADAAPVSARLLANSTTATATAMPQAQPQPQSTADLMAGRFNTVGATVAVSGTIPSTFATTDANARSATVAVSPRAATPAPAGDPLAEADPSPASSALPAAVVQAAPSAPALPAGVAASPAAPIVAADQPAPPIASPITAGAVASTANLTKPVAMRPDVRAGSAATRKAAANIDTDASATDAPSADAVADLTLPIPVATPAASHSAVSASTVASPAADRSAGQLAAGGTDRQVDLAKQGAWLDGIAHDIAATGDASSPLRFGIAPQHLGAVQVELLRGAEGAAVTLTASNEASRAALADAKPQLLADARAQGLHIASTQVDVGAHSSDSRPSSQGQGDSRPSTGSGGFSAQTNSHSGAQADSGRGSQTRSQPLSDNYRRMTGVGEVAAGAEPPPPAAPTDALYA
jgi:flagellar hook-length control protein FliK